MAVATCRCRTAPQYHASGHWNRNTRRQTSVPFLPFTRSGRLADCANRARRNVTFAAYSARLFLKFDCPSRAPRASRGGLDHSLYQEGKTRIFVEEIDLRVCASLMRTSWIVGGTIVQITCRRYSDTASLRRAELSARSRFFPR